MKIMKLPTKEDNSVEEQEDLNLDGNVKIINAMRILLIQEDYLVFVFVAREKRTQQSAVAKNFRTKSCFHLFVVTLTYSVFRGIM